MAYETHLEKHCFDPVMGEQQCHTLSGTVQTSLSASFQLALKMHLVSFLAPFNKKSLGSLI